jgi:large subunit ribosomal protein L4
MHNIRSMETNVYNQNGEKVGVVQAPESLFGVRWNPDLVHQVVTSMRANEREPIAHTKDRSEVRGGGKKPWRQKGTGRARHGSRRSPIWSGGGVAHGPRNERDFSTRISRKMKSAALASVISKKFSDGEIVFVDGLSLPAPKTREAKSVISALASIKGMESLSGKRKNALLVAVTKKTDDIDRAFGNIGNVVVVEVRNINPLSLLTYRYCAIADPEASFEILTRRLAAPVRSGRVAAKQ